MKKLTRHTEVPRSSHKELRVRYPGFQVIGDSTGYHWPVNETKTVVVSCTFKTLIEATKKHMVANEVKISPDLEREMNEFACESFPENCQEVDPDAERKINLWYKAKHFYAAVKSAVFDGIVPQEEAERRAAICAECPENGEQEIATCVGCFTAKFITEAAEALSSHHTSLDARLNTCKKCQCRLVLKVFVKKEAMQDKSIDWPQPCWMRE